MISDAVRRLGTGRVAKSCIDTYHPDPEHMAGGHRRLLLRRCFLRCWSVGHPDRYRVIGPGIAREVLPGNSLRTGCHNSTVSGEA